MICASASARSERILVLPWPPAPMMAMFTFSLGETKRGPPSTWRGTMVRAATPAVVAPRNLRRVNWRLDFGLFIMGQTCMGFSLLKADAVAIPGAAREQQGYEG